MAILQEYLISNLQKAYDNPLNPILLDNLAVDDRIVAPHYKKKSGPTQKKRKRAQ
jgi:hypothetical protein